MTRLELLRAIADSIEMPFEKVVHYSKMDSDIGDACRKALTEDEKQ